MKAAVFAAALAAPVMATEVSFAEWARAHGKVYKTKEELVLRRSIFAANVAKINAHNGSAAGWKMAVNKFADLTADEFKTRFASGYRAHEKRSKNVNLALLRSNVSALPTSVDWTTKGAVTPVKNQGQCGSCWAFSTTGSVEGISFISTGTLPDVSEQQLVDCSGAEGNQGCNGGLMDYGFEQIIKNKGICSESAYPYKGVDGKCKSTTCGTAAATITGYTDVPTNSETALLTAAAQQPVSVAVEADQSSFQFYTSGVMTAACGTNLDHGVLVVGYGTESGSDYYKVKNSWGADWGMAGQILLGRGASFGAAGQCGIQMQPSYPTKSQARYLSFARKRAA